MKNASEVVDWAVERWHAEVANRPLRNIHRRTLDDTWRQVIRRFGGDDEMLIGPRHDDLVADPADAVRSSPLNPQHQPPFNTLGETR